MRNIFMLYMPPTNYEALVHYEDTIKRGVSLESIARYLPVDMHARLKELFGNKPVAVWGSRNTPANSRKFDQMSIKDDILIVEGDVIKLLGLVAAKLVSPDLSRHLWKNLRGDSIAGWDLIYFIANAREIGLSFAAFCKILGYQETYRLHGFSIVSQEKLEAFYDQYDDVYDVLIRLRKGEVPDKKDAVRSAVPMQTTAKDGGAELTQEDVEEVLRSDVVSDHVKMQWKLFRLGLKAGVKVWVPPADQAKIRKLYEWNEFEQTFTTGIDLPAGYYENIDVVWKEQFRIDGAFEIENSTAIYSGLLRFADLSIVAPNTVYPLFIVAPAARRAQARAQLCRPTFRHFKLDARVRFLPYETIDEVDDFFASSSTGLNIELLSGKAEKLACM